MHYFLLMDEAMMLSTPHWSKKVMGNDVDKPSKMIANDLK